MPALIFTPELLERARRGTDALGPLLLQWAGSGEKGEQLREQIERAAALVPDGRRQRVLGPLSLQSSDDQVRTMVGTLLLAKTLADFGWVVEYEPPIGIQTPDLFVRNGSAQYVVEVRRVLGRLGDGNRMYLLLQRALRGIQTTTPLNLKHLAIDGAASLKPVVEHIKSVLAGAVPKGVQSFSSPGVHITYELSDPGEDEPIFPAVFSWQRPELYGDDSERVEVAINEKLRVYKQPIVVALDLVEVLGEYQAVRDAFYGAQPIVVPIDMMGRGSAGVARLGAMQNGMLVGRDRNAQRARERLIAVLPFDWGLTRSSATFELSAQLLGNPAIEPPQGFSEFAPIPRFIFSERKDEDTVMMRWEPAANPKDWSHRP